MPEANEIEQLNYLKELVQQMDQRVWSQSGFPAEDRPDIDALLPKLIIDADPPFNIQVHPNLLAALNTAAWNEMVSTGKAESREKHEVTEEKKVAQYDSITRVISLIPACLSLPERKLKRILAHELATDTYTKRTVTPYEELPEEIQKIINNSLLQFEQLGIPLDGSAELIEEGVLRSVAVDGYLVLSMDSPLLESLNEVYPTMFEVITSEIDRRGGDINKFDSDIQEGRLSISILEDHINFVNCLFRASQLVDWRILLHAFRQRDWQKGLEIVREANPEFGDGIFLRLMTEMKKDEDELEAQVQQLLKNGLRNR